MKFINSLSASDRFDIYRDMNFAEALHDAKIISDDLHIATLDACYIAHKLYDHGVQCTPFFETEVKEHIENVFAWLHEALTKISKYPRIARTIDAIAKDIHESYYVPLF